jgi:hypothetical protein
MFNCSFTEKRKKECKKLGMVPFRFAGHAYLGKADFGFGGLQQKQKGRISETILLFIYFKRNIEGLTITSFCQKSPILLSARYAATQPSAKPTQGVWGLAPRKPPKVSTRIWLRKTAV